MEKENIERLNALTALSRLRALTEEEQQERQRRRQEYLKAFRNQFRQQLDNTVVEYPDGSRVPLREAADRNESGGKNHG
ncbi:MAG: DUF896 domain-containing protein [Clostridia bacterium]|nr:DUF896 domain-containing protein [Clostridia bacterium]